MSKLVLNLAEILKEIPAGAWVAISEAQHQAIAYGADALTVLKEARVKGEHLPLMLRVPETDSAMAA
ncbi:MAG: hypothetical protein WBE76_29140 [Terracidiphilus sp.]